MAAQTRVRIPLRRGGSRNGPRAGQDTGGRVPPPREVNAGCEQMTTQYRELVEILQTVGKDPSRLIFEDELTGLNNRRFLLSFFEHKVQWDMETDFPLSLLMLDLDHFKQVNDTHGHEAGDQVLLWLSSLMQEISGDEHFPIRYGGDEFMLLVQGAEADEARMLADLLLQRTRTRPFQLRGTADPLPITLSIGVACAPRDASDGDGLLRCEPGLPVPCIVSAVEHVLADQRWARSRGALFRQKLPGWKPGRPASFPAFAA
ncbi:MAG TPA: GGDEF domain-containing protein [Acidobacteria bacterium]|nr:GGDEF domain-containing protein [Acidobacteriota bacterium]